MKDKAIAKITEEMMKSNNPAITYIEEYLTSQIEKSDEVARKVYESKKTLADVFEAIKQKAMASRGSNNYAVVPPDEALEIINKTYGITGTEEDKPVSADVSAFL